MSQVAGVAWGFHIQYLLRKRVYGCLERHHDIPTQPLFQSHRKPIECPGKLHENPEISVKRTAAGGVEGARTFIESQVEAAGQVDVSFA